MANFDITKFQVDSFKLCKMNPSDLQNVAKALVHANGGILVADETPTSMAKKFSTFDVENSSENWQRYREVLLLGPTPNLNGVILNEETIEQRTREGATFIQALRKKELIVGVKLDKGLMRFNDIETIAQGLEGLSHSVEKYKLLGCEFAKWRSTFTITPTTPSFKAIRKNMEDMAEFAEICQKGGLVPMLEPQILNVGNHDLEQAQFVTELILSYLLFCLKRRYVCLESTLFLIAMVTPGTDCEKKYNALQISEATVEALVRTMPPAVPGIVFLSGGLSPEAATRNLAKINNTGQNTPWPLTFCFSRALQSPVLEAWATEKGTEKAREVLRKLLIANSAARKGFDGLVF